MNLGKHSLQLTAYRNAAWMIRRRVAFVSAEPYTWRTNTGDWTFYDVHNRAWYLVCWWFTIGLRYSRSEPTRVQDVPMSWL